MGPAVVTGAIVTAIVCTMPMGHVQGHPSATASITGRVDVITRPSRKLATVGAYPVRTVSLPTPRRTSELQNVVVFLDGPLVEPSEPTRVTIRQTDEEFVPHVVVITTGSTVEFPNDDLVFHNVFSLSRAATFDLGRFPRHTSRSRTFSNPGIVKVFCHLHSHMSAIVRVFPHPHFAIPDEQGRFSLNGLPAGVHTVAAWHERVGQVEATITVPAGGSAEVSLSLPLTDEQP